jgi:hypothetical protein
MLEGLSCDVLGRIQIAGDGQREAEHDPLEATHERDCGVNVTRAELCQQYLVRQTVSVGTRRPRAVIDRRPPLIRW